MGKENCMKSMTSAVVGIVLLGFDIQPAMAEMSATTIFKKHCALCHDLNKRKIGPAFIQMSTDPEVLKTTITDGRNIMPKFRGRLSAEEIDTMVSYIRSIHAK